MEPKQMYGNSAPEGSGQNRPVVLSMAGRVPWNGRPRRLPYHMIRRREEERRRERELEEKQQERLARRRNRRAMNEETKSDNYSPWEDVDDIPIVYEWPADYSPPLSPEEKKILEEIVAGKKETDVEAGRSEKKGTGVKEDVDKEEGTGAAPQRH